MNDTRHTERKPKRLIFAMLATIAVLVALSVYLCTTRQPKLEEPFYVGAGVSCRVLANGTVTGCWLAPARVSE